MMSLRWLEIGNNTATVERGFTCIFLLVSQIGLNKVVHLFKVFICLFTNAC